MIGLATLFTSEPCRHRPRTLFSRSNMRPVQPEERCHDSRTAGFVRSSRCDLPVYKASRPPSNPFSAQKTFGFLFGRREGLSSFCPRVPAGFGTATPVSGHNPILEKNMMFKKAIASEKPRIKMKFFDASVFCPSPKNDLSIRGRVRAHSVYAGLDSIRETPAYESAIRFSLFECFSRW